MQVRRRERGGRLSGGAVAAAVLFVAALIVGLAYPAISRSTVRVVNASGERVQDVAVVISDSYGTNAYALRMGEDGSSATVCVDVPAGEGHAHVRFTDATGRPHDSDSRYIAARGDHFVFTIGPGCVVQYRSSGW